MDKQLILVVFNLAILSIALGSTGYILTQDVDATGGGKDIANLVSPMLDEVNKCLEQNDIPCAQETVKEIQNELKDTFQVEE